MYKITQANNCKITFFKNQPTINIEHSGKSQKYLYLFFSFKIGLIFSFHNKLKKNKKGYKHCIKKNRVFYNIFLNSIDKNSQETASEFRIKKKFRNISTKNQNCRKI